MKVREFKIRPLVMAIALLLANNAFAINQDVTDSAPSRPAESFGPYTGESLSLTNAPRLPGRYIVRFSEPAVPAHFASILAGGATPLTTAFKEKGRLRRAHLDATDSSVQSYVQQLQAQQAAHMSDIAGALGRMPKVARTVRFALNAAVLDELSADDVAKVSKLPGVASVRPDHVVRAATDIGPGFIGASSLWFGTEAAQDSIFAVSFEDQLGYRGDGIVIGDIDSGYNSLSPSFSAVDEYGYQIQNPLGSGNYIGQCGVASVSLAGCNDKVIGVYDELGTPEPGEPPTRAEDSYLDGHGSHTGSTAGGNARSATIGTFSARVSGVAPHANMVIYRALYAGGGTESAIVSAVDDAIQGGIVDALNYSVSGGADPWNEPVSLAFLSASSAGIFIAAAAGNTSGSVPVPVPGSANHLEPWVITVAASSHTGGPLVNALNLSGPGTPPALLMFANFSGTAYSGFTAPIASAPLVLSPQFVNADLTGTDGCSNYAPNQFANAIAVIARGTCAIADKVANAASAGAVAVIMSDNRPEDPTQINYGLGDTPVSVPVFSITQADGTALQNYLTSHPSGVTGNIPIESTRYPVQSDVLASFSLLGPSTSDVIKPDVQAPGVAILASVANDGSPDGPDHVAFYNGTSMATPHVTGTGALLLGLHPDWTPMEAKSALMMTAKATELSKQPNYPQIVPSGFFDRGSGRIQAFVASQAGLVLNESGLNFSYADPANSANATYVAPSALNLASIQISSCITVAADHLSSTPTCTFTRLFRSTQDHTVTWTPSFTGDISATTTPSSFTAVAGVNRQPLQIKVNAGGYNSDANFHFGEMILTPSDAKLAPLHLPMAIKVPHVTIATDQTSLSVAISAGQTKKVTTLNVQDVGGPTLAVSNTNDTADLTNGTLIDQTPSVTKYLPSNYWDDESHGVYIAEDFLASRPSTNLTRLSFPGAHNGTSGDMNTAFAGRGIHFEIYADTAGLPSGNPETVAPSYIWSYVATIGTTAGLSVTGDTISIDLTVAPSVTPTNLAPGKYWIAVYLDAPTFYVPNTLFTNGWFWSMSPAANGSDAHFIDPGRIYSNTTGSWQDNTATGPGADPGMAMHIDQAVPCGAPWLTTAPSTLTIGAGLSKPMNVTVDSTKFPAGQTSASAYLCLASNDPAHPIYSIPITATQN